MAFRNTSAHFYLAVSVFWEQFSLLVIATSSVAFLLRKRLKKHAAEDPPVKFYRPFNFSLVALRDKRSC